MYAQLYTDIIDSFEDPTTYLSVEQALIDNELRYSTFAKHAKDPMFCDIVADIKAAIQAKLNRLALNEKVNCVAAIYRMKAMKEPLEAHQQTDQAKNIPVISWARGAESAPAKINDLYAEFGFTVD
jgi:hypothetical protein